MFKKLIDKFAFWSHSGKAWQDGEWHFRSKKYSTSPDWYLVWCALKKLKAYSPVWEDGHIEVFVERGRSVEDAVSKLKEEINFNG